jgi:hypothetical protein
VLKPCNMTMSFFLFIMFKALLDSAFGAFGHLKLETVINSLL